jgi:DNA polymerase kappa
MFYVACELLDKPDYKDRPCAVGGENSVLCTANYAARIFGVGSAMPTFVAKKLCPELVLFKPNFDKYRSYSDIFRDILRKFDDKLESVGLDEAYIDMTHHLSGKSLEAQAELISTIRKEIFDRTKLTVSCGVGANKLLAKMGS